MTTTETIFRPFNPSAGHRSDRSAGDRSRHRAKIKDTIKKQLPDIIAEESIVGKDGDKIIKIPIKSIKEYRFSYGDNNGVGTGDGNAQPGQVIGKNGEGQQGQGHRKSGGEGHAEVYELDITLDELLQYLYEELKLPNLKKTNFKEIIAKSKLQKDGYRKVGIPIRLDRFRTAKQRIKRMKSMQRHGATFDECQNCDGTGYLELLPNEDDLTIIQQLAECPICSDCDGIGKVEKRIRFRNEDRIYKHMDPNPKPQSNAAIIFVIDSSGSMDTTKRFLARSFFFLFYNFVKAKYDKSEVVFITHDTEAVEVDEEHFFRTSDAGGTLMSSGLEKAINVIKTRYNPAIWNSYVVHCGDGDNFDVDNPKAVKAMLELCELCQLVGYGEIKPDSGSYWTGSSTMMQEYEGKIKSDNFRQFKIKNKDDVYPSLKDFLRIEDEVL